MIVDYTSYDAVRAVLGVSSEEIDDDVINLPLYEVMLSEDLLDLSGSIQTDFITVRDIPVGTQTDIEKRFVRVMQTYASYQVASTLLGSVALFAPKDITDSKASVTRVNDPFKTLKEDVLASLVYIRTRLLTAYDAYSPTYAAPTAVTRTFITSTGLAIDPVTNE